MKRIEFLITVIFFVSFLLPVRGEVASYIDESSSGDLPESGIKQSLAIDFQPYYLFSSFLDDVLSESLSTEGAANSHVGGALHLKYGFSFGDAYPQGRLYPGVRQGIGAGVNIFQYPKSIGVPVELYLFQGAPMVKFNPKVSIDYEWNFGASFGWKPCDGVTARSNLITGSRVNAYINLGIGMRWKLTHNYDLMAGIDITHFSNGNTSFPNPGINAVGLRFGISRSWGEERMKGVKDDSSPSGIDGIEGKSDTCEGGEGEIAHTMSYDLTAYGAWRKRVYRGGENPVLLKGHYAIAGLNFAPMWNVNRYFRTGLSADFQWDESSNLKSYYLGGSTTEDIRFSRGNFFSQVGVGLSARAELVMPFFSVNVGIGYNFIGPSEARASYQMANLKIYLTRGVYLNIGYQLQNFQRQNNLMLGLGYTFRSPRHPSTTLLGI